MTENQIPIIDPALLRISSNIDITVDDRQIFTCPDIYRFQEKMLDLQSSIEFDKEEFIEYVVNLSGLTPEEFGLTWVLDEYPIDIQTYNTFDKHMVFSIRQQFKVRLKTEDEKQLALENKEK